MAKTTRQKVLILARKTGVLRPRDLAAQGIPREYLVRLVKQGELKRHGRGLYTPARAPMSEHHFLAHVATRVPDAVVCLLSALSYYGVTTQQPAKIWIALSEKARAPKLDYPPLRVCRYSPATLAAGVDEIEIDGRTVKIFTLEKTIADCFKYRNKIGLDIALEALRVAWRKKRVKMSELEKYAAVCRVSQVVRPYLEALTA